jgi:uracil phosphoribosyltransferase
MKTLNKNNMLNLLNHPLLTHKLAILRDKDTGIKDFRKTLQEIASLMVYEVTRDLPLRKITIETPLARYDTGELACEVVLIPVLRAGLGLLEGILTQLPDARVGHMGMYRDHITLKPCTYYTNFPDNLTEAAVLVLDPMLATGGSCSGTIQVLKDAGAKNIRLVCIVGAPEGIARIMNDHPDVPVYLACLDEKLNESGYIVPGLGDAGDRLYGTGK